MMSKDFVKLFLNKPQPNLIRYAIIDENYEAGRPRIMFDGETILTVRQYPYLSSYTPVGGDRVMLVGDVIQGKIM